jgi:murein L,D-transpeptidase YafK
MLASALRTKAVLFLIPLLLAVTTAIGTAGELFSTPDNRLSLTIYKSQHEMYLYRGDQVVKVFHVFLGSSPVGHKFRRGDNKTPEGNYHVVDKRVSENFYRFISIDYPNAHDAELAFRQGTITEAQKTRIQRAVFQGIPPPADTALGGQVGIHGIGSDEKFKLKLIGNMDWTDGCIAVTNGEIRLLYQELPIGTLVRIRK